MTVSLKTYVDTLGAVVVVSILTLMFTINASNNKATKLALDNEQLARTVAMTSSTEMLKFHNDLIRKGEVKDTTYVTRGQVYAALTTALVMAGLAIAFYANFGGN